MFTQPAMIHNTHNITININSNAR